MAARAITTATVREVVLVVLMVRRELVRSVVAEMEEAAARALGAMRAAVCDGADRASSVPNADAIAVAESVTPRAVSRPESLSRARLRRFLHAPSLSPVAAAISPNFLSR